MNTRVHLSNRCGSIILFCVSDFTVTLNEHKRASLRLRHQEALQHNSNYTFVTVDGGGKLCVVSKEKRRQWGFLSESV